MLLSEANLLDYHLDKKRFLAAIEYTAAATGFQPELIEKDYYCSVLLNYFDSCKLDLVFKGGTLLAKVHAGFYRLSEDLDFSISVSPQATRKKRSLLAQPAKAAISTVPECLDIFTVKIPLTGTNLSGQYNAELNYGSVLGKVAGRILVEIGLREEPQLKTESRKLNTILLNPFTGMPALQAINFKCLAKLEAYAEKFRAALSREKLAIRDFYDIQFALSSSLIDINDVDFIELVKSKLKVQLAPLVDFTDERVQMLVQKIDTELMPTVNQLSSVEFELERVIEILKKFTADHLK